jgi:hypothetical protein
MLASREHNIRIEPLDEIVRDRGIHKEGAPCDEQRNGPFLRPKQHFRALPVEPLTKSALNCGEAERFTLNGRGHAAIGESASGARPAERGSSRQYWPFSRQCTAVRQPEARRTRSRNRLAPQIGCSSSGFSGDSVKLTQQFSSESKRLGYPELVDAGQHHAAR